MESENNNDGTISRFSEVHEQDDLKNNNEATANYGGKEDSRIDLLSSNHTGIPIGNDFSPKKEKVVTDQTTEDESEFLDFHLCTEEELISYLNKLEQKYYGEDSDSYDINDVNEMRGYYNAMTNKTVQTTVDKSNLDDPSENSVNIKATKKTVREPLDIVSSSLLIYDFTTESHCTSYTRFFSKREKDLLLNFESVYKRKEEEDKNNDKQATNVKSSDKIIDDIKVEPLLSPFKFVEEAFELVEALYLMHDEEDEENLELQVYKIKFATRLEDWRRGYLPTVKFAKCLLNVKHELSSELLRKLEMKLEKQKKTTKGLRDTTIQQDDNGELEPLKKKYKNEKMNKLELSSAFLDKAPLHVEHNVSINSLNLDNTLIVYWPKIASLTLTLEERKKVSLQKLIARFRRLVEHNRSNSKETNVANNNVSDYLSVRIRQIADEYFAISYLEKSVRDQELLIHSYQKRMLPDLLEVAKTNWILASSKEHYIRLPSSEEIVKLESLPSLYN